MALTFRCPGAKSVSLAGDFNAWDVAGHPMTYEPTRSAWMITLELPPGRHEYKFFVNGQDWWNDPNAATVPNVWGSEHSYLDVSRGPTQTRAASSPSFSTRDRQLTEAR